MTNSDLAQLNLCRSSQGLSPFANTRNVTAGTMRLQDPKIAAERRMRFFCHGVGYCDGLSSDNHMGFLQDLQGLRPTGHTARASFPVGTGCAQPTRRSAISAFTSSTSKWTDSC